MSRPDGCRFTHWHFASGYVGQLIILVPALDLIIVRNGDTPVERRHHVMTLVGRIISLFRTA